MLVQGDGEVYFIDRDNSVFQVNGLTFPHVREDRCLRDTLMDGVCYKIYILFKNRVKNVVIFLLRTKILN